ncbi:MAG: hypothetical protein ACLT90_16050 [Enterococcus raffinosus]
MAMVSDVGQPASSTKIRWGCIYDFMASLAKLKRYVYKTDQLSVRGQCCGNRSRAIAGKTTLKKTSRAMKKHRTVNSTLRKKWDRQAEDHLKKWLKIRYRNWYR